MSEVNLDSMIEHEISLVAPAEKGMTWCAQVPLFGNQFIVEHLDPKKAIQTCIDELRENGLLDESSPAEAERDSGFFKQYLVSITVDMCERGSRDVKVIVEAESRHRAAVEAILKRSGKPYDLLDWEQFEKGFLEAEELKCDVHYRVTRIDVLTLEELPIVRKFLQ